MIKTAKIFISHSSKDKEFARRLSNDLQARNVPVWFDELEIKVGDSLNNKIQEGINESGWLGIILSKNSVQSPWVEQELNAALSKELEKKQVFVLPIVIDECEIPLFLKDKLFADFRTDYDNGLGVLLKRLIPEGSKYYAENVSGDAGIRSQRTEIERQPLLPKLEDFNIKIIDIRIEGQNAQHSGLYDVAFELDKRPDQDWCQLFENPSTFIVSIHKAHVNGKFIQWSASEEHIKEKKHWIYDWVEDANKRFEPIAIKRIQIQEDNYRKDQLGGAKIAELESILKGGREGTLIFPTDEVMVGKCSLRLDNCAAPNNPGPITQVNFENNNLIHVCFSCLDSQLEDSKWRTG